MKKLLSCILSLLIVFTSTPLKINGMENDFDEINKKNGMELIYKDNYSKIYSKTMSDETVKLYQFDEGVLTSTVDINPNKNQGKINVVYFDGNTNKELRRESFNDADIIKKVDTKQIDNIEAYSGGYSKLGDIVCLLSYEGSQIDIGYFYKTTASGVQTAYTPEAGKNFTKSVLIGAIISTLVIVPSIAGKALQLMINIGTAIVSGALVSFVSSQPVIAKKTTYSVKLNRYDNNTILYRDAGFVTFSHRGLSETEYYGILPYKNSSTAIDVIQQMFPNGGATFINWK